KKVIIEKIKKNSALGGAHFLFKESGFSKESRTLNEK
ncbi:hypothetical protein LCGC14_2231660, partial [marine sediment metagenome]